MSILSCFGGHESLFGGGPSSFLASMVSSRFMGAIAKAGSGARIDDATSCTAASANVAINPLEDDVSDVLALKELA